MRYLILLFNVLPGFLLAQTDHKHPRSFLDATEVPALREKIEREPFKSMYEAFRQITTEEQAEQAKQAYDPYADGDLMVKQAMLYLLTGEPGWAEVCRVSAGRVMQDEKFLKNALSFGLTRARLLKNLALSYDFCYDAWEPAFRQQVNDQLYETMFSVNANMGHAANYNIESNWMGVRYGSVILASLVWDPEQEAGRTPQQPLEWDATKRLGEHLEKSIFTNGWNGESMSYHIYGWTFVGPALLAMEQNLGSFCLMDFAPQIRNSLHALMTSTVAIEHRGIRGLQADLSDDDLMFSTGGVLSMGFSLYPQEQHAALRWMHDYLIPPEDYEHYTDETLFYSILYYPEDVKPQNPAKIGWLTYQDPQQGVVIHRNRFRDENDIVSTYNAKQTRVRGHAGPDANTFRLVGLGVPWVIGGGRTGYTAGQTNLFPSEEETYEKDSKGQGTLHAYEFAGNHSYALGSGSPVGTEDHQRIMYTSYDEKSQAAAVVVVRDRSANGKRWRINTPEFNEMHKIEDGYQLTAPDGSSMQITFLSWNEQSKLDTGKVRYGGATQRNNNGIWYQNELYTHSRYIDFYCYRDVLAVITLQAADKAYPPVRMDHDNSGIKVGELKIELPDFPRPPN